jgi:hypothetical protein
MRVLGSVPHPRCSPPRDLGLRFRVNPKSGYYKGVGCCPSPPGAHLVVALHLPEKPGVVLLQAGAYTRPLFGSTEAHSVE